MRFRWVLSVSLGCLPSSLRFPPRASPEPCPPSFSDCCSFLSIPCTPTVSCSSSFSVNSRGNHSSSLLNLQWLPSAPGLRSELPAGLPQRVPFTPPTPPSKFRLFWPLYFLIGPARLFTYGLCIAKLSLRSLGTRAETWTPGRIPLRQLPAVLSHDYISLVPAGALSPPPDRQFQGIGLAGLCTPVGPASDTWGGLARHLSVQGGRAVWEPRSPFCRGESGSEPPGPLEQEPCWTAVHTESVGSCFLGPPADLCRHHENQRHSRARRTRFKWG